MKALLEFDLSDPDDQRRHAQYINAPKMASALWDFAQKIREKRKYSEQDTWEILDVSEVFYQTLADNNVNLDEAVW